MVGGAILLRGAWADFNVSKTCTVGMRKLIER